MGKPRRKANSGPSPDRIRSEKDRGDDMTRRIRYQAACNAIKALALVREPSKFSELYCEHHEDGLLRRTDGRFVGIQIKTASSPLRAGGEAALNSLKRFVEHEKTFGRRFARYVLATNKPCGLGRELGFDLFGLLP